MDQNRHGICLNCEARLICWASSNPACTFDEALAHMDGRCPACLTKNTYIETPPAEAFESWIRGYTLAKNFIAPECRLSFPPPF